jgi:hypothetical protein
VGQNPAASLSLARAFGSSGNRARRLTARRPGALDSGVLMTEIDEYAPRFS